MTGPQLIQALESAGVRFRLEGEKVLFAPVDRVGADLVAQLRSHKAEVVAELRRRESPDLDEGEVLEQKTEPVAWRIWSRTLERELWLARDRRARDEIAAEFPGVPVLLLAEIPLLRGKLPEVLRAIAEAKAAFPDAELEA